MKNKVRELRVGDRVSFLLETWDKHFFWFREKYGRDVNFPDGGATTFNHIRWFTWVVEEIHEEGYMTFTNGKYFIGHIPVELANQWLARRID